MVLVFDGDEAGRRATESALFGLLPLDLELVVAQPPPGSDPCDMIVRDGAEVFRALLEGATPWFDFILAGLADLAPRELSSAVDGVLRLVEPGNGTKTMAIGTTSGACFPPCSAA